MGGSSHPGFSQHLHGATAPPLCKRECPSRLGPRRMGGHFRLWHPKWFTRYVWGGFAGIQLMGFAADQQYGINRTKNPETTWPWWQEMMRKKENGEIPMKMPGYMLCKFRNEPEERWTDAEDNQEKYGEFTGAMSSEE